MEIGVIGLLIGCATALIYLVYLGLWCCMDLYLRSKAMEIGVIGLLIGCATALICMVIWFISLVVGGDFEDFMYAFFLPGTFIPLLLGVIWFMVIAICVGPKGW